MTVVSGHPCMGYDSAHASTSKVRTSPTRTPAGPVIAHSPCSRTKTAAERWTAGSPSSSRTLASRPEYGLHDRAAAQRLAIVALAGAAGQRQERQEGQPRAHARGSVR